MVRNEHEIVIDCPAEQVFRFVTDFDTWRQWHGQPEKAEKTTPGDIAVGTTWDFAGQIQGQPLTMTIEITEYEPNRQFGFKTISGPIQARQVFVFELVGKGTRLKVFLDLANPEMAPPARQQWEKDLLVLKRLLEVQT